MPKAQVRRHWELGEGRSMEQVSSYASSGDAVVTRPVEDQQVPQERCGGMMRRFGELYDGPSWYDSMSWVKLSLEWHMCRFSCWVSSDMEMVTTYLSTWSFEDQRVSYEVRCLRRWLVKRCGNQVFVVAGA